jgi:peroxiredoxin
MKAITSLPALLSLALLSLALLSLALLSLALAAGGANAHDPKYHGVRLVRFQRPIPAPEFTLPDPQGRPVRLGDLRGRWVLLNFWATWCPPCVQEMPSLERLSRAMAERPFTVLAISLDVEGAAKVKPFAAHLGLTFPIVLDREGRVADRYGASDLPATFILDPAGQVVLAAKGARDWASPEILAYLQELISGPG